MPLISWRPFSDFENFFEDDDYLLPVLPRWDTPKPAMGVYETDKEVIAEINLPGIEPEKVQVSVKDDL